MISFPQILILAVIQGLAELLPVSSSAHVIVAEKLMGLDPTAPELTMLLVMLHTGTMFAVIVYFWKSWKQNFFSSKERVINSLKYIGIATIATIAVGLILQKVIEKIVLKGAAHAEVEQLFGNLLLIASSLALVGAFILITGLKKSDSEKSSLNTFSAIVIGLVQGLCLPFRGFSRSGATISTGLVLGIERKTVEDFSFALAVVLTPLVIGKEALRFLKVVHASGQSDLSIFLPSLGGMVLSFIAGLLALKWLSSWLEGGRWYWFGFYCIAASAVIFFLYAQGY